MSDEQGADACECKFAVAECDIEQVVVYADRAEVTRRVDLDPATTGAADLCRVLITSVSSRMDADSVRVKGTGPATILEVGTDVSFDADDVDTAGTARERTKLDSELKAKRKARAAVEAALARSRVERELLVKYAETSASQPPAGPSTTSAAATAPIDPSSMQKVLEFYAARAASIDETSAQLSEQKADLDGEIRALEQQLGRLRAPPKRRSQTVRVRLALDTPPPGGPAKPAPPAPVCLRVTYMVQGASWEPSYDARADLEGGGRALGLQLSYYGCARARRRSLRAHLRPALAHPRACARTHAAVTRTRHAHAARAHPHPSHHQHGDQLHGRGLEGHAPRALHGTARHGRPAAHAADDGARLEEQANAAPARAARRARPALDAVRAH